jgi:hypothetical protein
MLPMSDQAILQQNKLRRLREEMMEVSMSRKHIEIYSSKNMLKFFWIRGDDRSNQSTEA